MRTPEQIEHLRAQFAAAYDIKGLSVQACEEITGVKYPYEGGIASHFRWQIEVEARIKWLHADAMLRNMPIAASEGEAAIELLKECLPILEFVVNGDCLCDYQSGSICHKCTAKNIIQSVKAEVAL